MKDTYPYLSDRIQSTFIDTILIIVLMFAFTSILDKFTDVPQWVRIVGFSGLFFAYEPLLMTFGCTFGNYIKGIRVRKSSDTDMKINIFQAVIRYLFKIILGWVSFFTINSNPRRRAIHDLVSGTVMVKI